MSGVDGTRYCSPRRSPRSKRGEEEDDRTRDQSPLPHVGGYIQGIDRASFSSLTIAVLCLPLLMIACRTVNPQQRAADAKSIFDQILTQYHLPSAEAQGADKTKLLAQAAAGYQQLLRRYPEQKYYAAQALRSLGNVRAEQGRMDEAVKLYREVGEKYPDQDWEVMQAWKSAADLLWERGHKNDARTFYARIVDRYDKPGVPSVYRTIVTASKRRLTGK